MTTFVRIQLSDQMLMSCVDKNHVKRIVAHEVVEAGLKLRVRGFEVERVVQQARTDFRGFTDILVIGKPLPPSCGWDSEGRECWEYPT